ncbi:winged helix-turn helix domain-containing protein [Ditylenchus destructor]|uniref:Winged helix-turn helix domain-containing protein n=1 Tax=Ditylenchus destructor TaxID=166010 RepID=A0AAD4MFS6_9BILA|nr:winged helix-turn helix domain-containing protein [Ditylenchus destructor]
MASAEHLSNVSVVRRVHCILTIAVSAITNMGLLLDRNAEGIWANMGSNIGWGISSVTTFRFGFFLLFTYSGNFQLFILFIIKMSSKRAAIIELYKQGQGVNNIARLLKMHKQSVIRAMSRFKELGTLEDRPRSGRPPDVRVQKAKKAIKAKLRRNPKRSMRMLAKEGEISNRQSGA